MPEGLGLLWSVPEKPVKAPIIKVSCGIGDTTGFPFDVDLDSAYATKNDSKWGFLITGGAEFYMPLTVFQVMPNGLADKGGIRLGDIILEINEEDATKLSLAQAHEKINSSGKQIHLLLKNMDEDDPMGICAAGEEKSIVLHVPKPLPPAKETLKAAGTGNSARATAISIEARLLEMQRKLSAIAVIPKILSSTLATVSQTFDKLRLEELMPAEYAKRKCCYDEDAIDYQLSAVDECNQNELQESVNEDDDIIKVSLGEYSHVMQSKLKDVMPELDYASAINYATNEASDSNKHSDNEGASSAGSEDEDILDIASNSEADTVYYLKLNTVANQYITIYDRKENDTEDNDNDVDDANVVDDEQDGNNFVSTNYAWNLCNVPKLRINDEHHEFELTLNAQEQQQARSQTTQSQTNQSQPGTQEHDINTSKQISLQALNADDDNDDVVDDIKVYVNMKQTSTTEVPKKVIFKLDNMERSWPWADRQKIIYKQSTCHLMPRKPLGLIKKRIQLLAQQNLGKLQQADATK